MTLEETIKTETTAVHDGQRLDYCLAELWPDNSRTFWKRAIQQGRVLVNGLPAASASIKVNAGDEISLLPALPGLEPEDINLPILAETDDWLVIDKPSGLLVHAKGAAVEEPTVTSMLSDKIEPDGTNRPGIVHRLDRATSGVMIVAKNKTTRVELQRLFSQRKVHKLYTALVSGTVTDTEAELTWPLARDPKNPSRFRADSRGKSALTRLVRVCALNGVSEVDLSPETGRTHQLRVHMAKYGYPILGDSVYAPPDVRAMAPRLCLHASKLTFELRGESHEFASELPKELTVLRERYA